jgi:hypothetical protein
MIVNTNIGLVIDLLAFDDKVLLFVQHFKCIKDDSVQVLTVWKVCIGLNEAALQKGINSFHVAIQTHLANPPSSHGA